MECGRVALLLLSSLVYTLVLSLMTGAISVLSWVYPFGIAMGAGGWRSYIQVFLMYQSLCL